MINKLAIAIVTILVVTVSLTADADVRKYHPGHYVSMNRTDDRSDMVEAIKPGIVGVQKRYMWKDLEPGMGKYDFSEIQSDLDLLTGKGMRLVAMIEDKSFNMEKLTPGYMQDEYTLRNRSGGYTADRWSPYVVTRMKALMNALGKQFDAQPNFEGVAIQESALSLDDDVLAKNGYTPEKYRDALIDVIGSAARSLPSSRVFWYMNFLHGEQSYIGDIATAVAPYGVVMGGPDVLPDSAPLEKLVYPFYREFQGKMPLFCSMQFDSYRHPHKDKSASTRYWTMDEMFRFARDDLHVSYLFWNRKTGRGKANTYNWNDALPVIAANPVFNRKL